MLTKTSTSYLLQRLIFLFWENVIFKNDNFTNDMKRGWRDKVGVQCIDGIKFQSDIVSNTCVYYTWMIVYRYNWYALLFCINNIITVVIMCVIQQCHRTQI